jgi:co-chaperonin GroES (HSP10)
MIRTNAAHSTREGFKLLASPGWVFVQPLPEVEGTSAAGLVLPNVSPHAGKRGTVLSAGWWEELEGGDTGTAQLAEEGDVVLFPSSSGIPFFERGEQLLALRVEEILGVVDAEE